MFNSDGQVSELEWKKKKKMLVEIFLVPTTILSDNLDWHAAFIYLAL